MSDHASGPRAIAGPAGDISDFYAFPSPARPGNLVLVMNTRPFAKPTDLFSDGIIYRFRLRPVTVAATGRAAAFAVGEEEFRFDCTFSEPITQEGSVELVQEGTCILPTGERVSFRVNDEKGVIAGNVHVFAGIRSDPFFFDLDGLMETVKTRKLAFKTVGSFKAPGAMVLSIVIAMDGAKILKGIPMFGVIAETLSAGKLPIRIERVGRPEIKNITMGWTQFDTVNRDLEIRDMYNNEDAFNLNHHYTGAYRGRLNANLAFFDSLDGETHWPSDKNGVHPLTELLLADFLVVDVSKPFAEDSFWGIERAMLQGRKHETCGGRSLNDDFIDTMYTLYINAEKGPRIRDGLDEPQVPVSRTHPFLAPPVVPNRPEQIGP